MATLHRRAACVSSGHQLPIMPATIAVRHAEQPHRGCKVSAWTFRHAGPATAAQQTAVQVSAMVGHQSRNVQHGFCFLSLLPARAELSYICVCSMLYVSVITSCQFHMLQVNAFILSPKAACMHAALLTPAQHPKRQHTRPSLIHA